LQNKVFSWGTEEKFKCKLSYDVILQL